jgi:hypothetical protein
MTTMYLIHVDTRAADTFQGRIVLINPDAFYFPAGPDFPLQLIVELWHSAPRDDDAAMRDEFAELWALALGRQITITAEERQQLQRSYDEGRRAIERKYLVRLGAWGAAGERSFIHTSADPDEFCWRAGEIIAAYRLGEPQHLPPGVEPWSVPEDEKFRVLNGPSERWPYAAFTVTVHDPRYLEHVQAPMQFETAFIGY